MNPFRRNPLQPVTEPITEPISEQDLFAFHLNELPPARARAVRRRLAEDAGLAEESASIAAAFAAVTLNAGAASRVGLPLDRAILDRNWQAIRPALGAHTPVSSPWQTSAFATCALAATAACIALIASYVAQYRHPAGAGEKQVLYPHTAAAPQIPPAAPVRTPILTFTPTGQTSLHAKDPGIRADFTSGVYRPRAGSADAPIHLIGLAPHVEQAAEASGPETVKPAPLTALPVPPLTPEPQPPLQVTPSGKTTPHLPGKARHGHPIDIMLGMGGTFVPGNASGSANTESRTANVSYAVVAIGSLHQQFRRALGYRATLSYTRPDFAYTNAASNPGTGFYQAGSINSRIFEAAGTYVVEGPHHKRLSTSVDVGGALMAFLPNGGADPAANVSYRPGGVLGVNVDYAITKHVGARAGYRAQIFKSPSFRYNGSTIPVTTPYLVDNEPWLGVTYTFGKP
jgi:hypothetical protein